MCRDDLGQMPAFPDCERMQLTIFATKGNSMSKQQKFFSRTPIAAAVLAVSAATFTLDAEAALYFLREVKGPVTVTGTGATAKYSFSIQMRVINDDNIPATGTPPAAVAIQIADAIKASFPSAIQNSVIVSNLQILPEDVGCDSTAYNCMTPTGAKKPTPFTTVTDLTLNSGFKGVATGTDKGDEIFATGQKLDPYSVVTVRYDVEFVPGASKGPFTSSATLNGGQSDDATFIMPADKGVRQSECPTGTVPSNINLVSNGTFANGQGKDSKGDAIKVTPGGQIAGSFKSDYQYAGDDTYADYNQISITTGKRITINELSHFQYPFPGAKKNGDVPAIGDAPGYLLGAGPKPATKTGELSLGADSAIWMESVTGLDTGATYQFEAWVSNPAPVKEVSGTGGADPEVVLVADADKSQKVTLTEETGTDSWQQILMTVKPSKTSMNLEIRNERVLDTTKGENFDLFAVTAIGLRKCVAPDDVDKVDTGSGSSGGTGDSDDNSGGSNTGGGSGSDTGTGGSTGGTDSSGSGTSAPKKGGGGGALGFALAGMGLIGLRRRRL